MPSSPPLKGKALGRGFSVPPGCLRNPQRPLSSCCLERAVWTLRIKSRQHQPLFVHPLGSAGASAAQCPGLRSLMGEQELMRPEPQLKTVSQTWDVSPYVWCTSHTWGKVPSIHLGILGWVLRDGIGWDGMGWDGMRWDGAELGPSLPGKLGGSEEAMPDLPWTGTEAVPGSWGWITWGNQHPARSNTFSIYTIKPTLPATPTFTLF